MIYKLYFGGYDKKHIPPLTLLEKSTKKALLINIQKLLEILPYGLDLYIEKPDGKIYAWHRDLKKYTENEIEEILK